MKNVKLGSKNGKRDKEGAVEVDDEHNPSWGGG